MFLKFFKRCFDSRDSFFDGRDDDVVKTSRFLLPVFFSGEHVARQDFFFFFFFFFFSVEGGSILNDKAKSDDVTDTSLPPTQYMKREKKRNEFRVLEKEIKPSCVYLFSLFVLYIWECCTHTATKHHHHHHHVDDDDDFDDEVPEWPNGVLFGKNIHHHHQQQQHQEQL